MYKHLHAHTWMYSILYNVHVYSISTFRAFDLLGFDVSHQNVLRIGIFNRTRVLKGLK